MAKLERRLTIISRKLPASVQRSGLTSFQTSLITLVEPLPWGQSCANRRKDAIDRPSLRRCVTSRGGDERKICPPRRTITCGTVFKITPSGGLTASTRFHSIGTFPEELTSVVNRVIIPALNLCERCHKRENDHGNAEDEYKRDELIPVWHGWHAARRGLGSNLYRLGVPDIVIQRILRHANVSTTATYYIKTAADDVRGAMAKLEKQITDEAVKHRNGDQQTSPGRNASVGSSTIN